MSENPSRKSAKPSRPPAAGKAPAKPALPSGGNPQIPKGYGDAPVQAYIAAMPGWKHDVGRRLDALIMRTVPGVRKAVKWNSPLYGAGDADQGWFLSFHCFTKYVKVGFFRGTSLHPVPPGESTQKEVRYLHIHENDPLDEPQLAAWVKQANELPGEDVSHYAVSLGHHRSLIHWIDTAALMASPLSPAAEHLTFAADLDGVL